MAKVTDMTVGNPTKLLVSFAMPMLLGNLFQQMYSMVDTIVVGRGVGVEALAAVGAAGWLDWLVLGIVMGLMQGFTILVSQRFGAEDYNGLRKSVAMSAFLAGITIVVFTTVSLIMARPLLTFLNTPQETINDAHLYISIIYCGIPVIVTYNLLAAILRALGDSRTPLIAMVIASVMNIGLDILFVMGFSWGVAGAAVATVMAQVFSCIFCFLTIRRLPVLRMKRSDWRIDGAICKQLLRLGLPVALQNDVISSGGLVVQYIVNGFGYIFVAGVTAAHKVCSLMEQAGSSFASAMGTFAGQNLGAEKYDRIRMGVRKALKITVTIAFLIAAVVIAFGRYIIRFFVSDEPEIVAQVVDAAYPFLIIMCSCLFVLYILFVYRTTLQGMGDTLIPMVSGLVELGMRIGMVLLLTSVVGKFGVYFAEVAAWIGAAILLIAAYYWRIGKICPRQKNTAQSEGKA